MVVYYIVSPYPALKENMVAKIYEASDPDSEIDSVVLPETDSAGNPVPGGGHNRHAPVTFTGLDFVNHIVRLFTANGTKLHDFNALARRDKVTVFTPIRFRIGDGGINTPLAGMTVYSNTDLAGLEADDYVAFRNGHGVAFEGVMIENSPSGGFSLIQEGDVFSGEPPEEWTIMQVPKAITEIVNDSVVGKQWGPTVGNDNIFVDVTSAVSYTTTHLRKLIRLAGSSAEYTFGMSEVPPRGYPFRITNLGGYSSTTPAPKVKFANAQLIYGNTLLNEIEIPFPGTFEFVFDGTLWNCTINPPPVTSTAPVSGQIVYYGRFVIGDLPPEGLFTIQHNQNLSYQYRAIVTVYSRNVQPARDNTVTLAVREYTANNFKVTAQEIFGDQQAIDFDYFLVKV